MIRKIAVLLLVIAAALSFFTTRHSADAITGANWRAGRIIDDIIFTNKGDMSPDQIQQFLNRMVGTGGNGRIAGQCDTNGVGISELGGGTRAQYGIAHGNGGVFTCLKDYYEVPKTTPGPGMPANNYGGAPVPAGARSAAQLIWDAAQTYSISPKVLLVMIQKESAGPLITDDWPFLSQYTYAMGAHCPDTTGCDPNYAGFSIQISESAALLRYYLDNMNQPWWPYKKVGVNNILYSPTASCGSSNVMVESMSTAALYTYTPYQPNAAALSVVTDSSPGGSVPCGAYGNRNFWWYFNKWFGSSYSNDSFVPHPDGALVAINNTVYLISNNTKRPISTPSVFLSYGYQWYEVKRATAGDYNLPDGIPLNIINPGTLFRTPTSSVYTMVWDSSASAWVKQMVSYSGFVNLGYRWDEVQVIPYGELPPGDYATLLTADRHPSRTLIRAANDSRVYMVDTGTRRYIPRPEVLYSYHYWWSDIKVATAADNQLPVGADLPYREGTVLFDGSNLYITDLPPTGDNIKRPIAPWECFSDRLSYRLGEALNLPADGLPAGNGPLIYC
jgi:hypothetical protein